MTDKSDKDFVTNAFARLSPVEPSATLSRRVATIPLHHEQVEAAGWWPFGSIWAPALGLVAAGCLGFFSGDWRDPDPQPTAELQRGVTQSAPLIAKTLTSEDAVLGSLSNLASHDQELEDLEGLLALATLSDFAEDTWEVALEDAPQQEVELTQ